MVQDALEECRISKESNLKRVSYVYHQCHKRVCLNSIVYIVYINILFLYTANRIIFSEIYVIRFIYYM